LRIFLAFLLSANNGELCSRAAFSDSYRKAAAKERERPSGNLAEMQTGGLLERGSPPRNDARVLLKQKREKSESKKFGY